MLWRRLDLALALVALGGDTGEWFGLLLPEPFVGSLLPLAGHGVRRRAGKQAHAGEQQEGGTDADGGVQGNLLALTRWRQRAGAVGTESDPVRC